MKTKTLDPRIAQKVLEMVATHYNTTPDALKSETGHPIAKKVVMYSLKVGLGASVRTSREAVGKKYDTEVYQAIKRVDKLRENDTALVELVERIKAEILMIAVTPDGNSQVSSQLESISCPVTSEKSTMVLQVNHSGNLSQIITSVQEAVTKVFLGVNLLRSFDPGAEVILAKDSVVFLVWDDFPKIPLPEILEAFHIDQDCFYRTIGRITFCLKADGGELKKKLRAARDAFTLA